jgi:GT2 family glycosyltransferase
MGFTSANTRLEKRFSIKGFGEQTTAELLLSGGPSLEDAIAVCEHEIALIDDAIRRENISAPKGFRVPEPLNFSVEEILPPVDGIVESNIPLVPEVTEFDLSRQHIPSWARIRGVRRFFARAAILRFEQLVTAVLEAARPGPIVVVGHRWMTWSAANCFARHGRSTVLLESGYGCASQEIVPGYLQRPSPDSFLEWLLRRHAKLADVGALVFLGESSFAVDFAALADVPDQPPVVVGHLDGAGCARVTAMHSDGVGAGQPAAAATVLPRISIVTVSFNQAQYLEASIRSVLDQNYPNLDYVVIDGGSTDGSIEIIERYRSHFSAVVIEPDEGQSDALNKGFRLAKGEVMNWLCSDDLLEPGALDQVARCYSRTGADLIVGGCVRIGETRNAVLQHHHTALKIGETVPIDPVDILKFMNSWQRGHYFFQPEIFFSRRIWQASGAYIKRHLFYVMDYDMWLRMALAGARIHHVPATLGCSRVHALQKTQADQKYLHQVRYLLLEYRDIFSRLSKLESASDMRAYSAVT